ncbi:MAG: four-carbon acid sugar kinase family protein [Lachnospirales bacterium]
MNINELYRNKLKSFNKKIIVLDDDPTGTQTVQDITVYTKSTYKYIKEGFLENSPMFFILTNSRSFSEDETKYYHEEIAQKIEQVSIELSMDYIIISRSDSTLRGHYPIETEIINETLGGFHGEIICPFFYEGKRFTFNNTHYLEQNGNLLQVSETEFAKDKTFGYKNSHLGKFIEEKSNGSYLEKDTIYIELDEIRKYNLYSIKEKLFSAEKFTKIVVNAMCYEDLKVFTIALIDVINTGKSFLFRTAASFPKIIGGVIDVPLLNGFDLTKDNKGGIIIIGSYVQKTTEQLNELINNYNLDFQEFNVYKISETNGLQKETSRIVSICNANIIKGKTTVIYTSRKLINTKEMSKEEALKMSVDISSSFTKIIGQLESRPKYILAKGGMTASDVATIALKVTKGKILGQIEKGIPVWLTDNNSKFPCIPYIIFPGNVGEVETLNNIVKGLEEYDYKSVIISVAPISTSTHLNIKTLCEDVRKCSELGASICHLSSKNIIYTNKVLQYIYNNDIIIQTSLEKGLTSLTYEKVISSSVIGGSINLDGEVYINSTNDIKLFLETITEKNITPEIDIYDISMIYNIVDLQKELNFKRPIIYNLVFGREGGLPATIECLTTLKSFVPDNCIWGVTHYERKDWSFITTALGMGAKLIRVGFENSSYLSNNIKAKYNYEILKELAQIIKAIGLKTSTDNTTKKIIQAKF